MPLLLGDIEARAGRGMLPVVFQSFAAEKNQAFQATEQYCRQLLMPC